MEVIHILKKGIYPTIEYINKLKITEFDILTKFITVPPQTLFDTIIDQIKMFDYLVFFGKKRCDLFDLLELIDLLIKIKGKEFIKEITIACKYMNSALSHPMMIFPEYCLILGYIVTKKLSYCDICADNNYIFFLKCGHNYCSKCYVLRNIFTNTCCLCRQIAIVKLHNKN